MITTKEDYERARRAEDAARTEYVRHALAGTATELKVGRAAHEGRNAHYAALKEHGEWVKRLDAHLAEVVQEWLAENNL